MANTEGTGGPTEQAGQGGVAPGWYPDPTNGALRWFDGSQWGQYAEQAQGQTPAPSAAGTPSASQAALAHYLGIIGFIGPLIIYMTSQDKDAFVKDQATEALNFHLTVLIGWFVAILLSFVCIGFLLMPVLWIGEIVFSVIGGMAASKGEWYRYPITIRMIKSPAA